MSLRSVYLVSPSQSADKYFTTGHGCFLPCPSKLSLAGAVTADRLICKASFNKVRNHQAWGNLIFLEAFSNPIMWPNTLTFAGTDISTFTAA